MSLFAAVFVLAAATVCAGSSGRQSGPLSVEVEGVGRDRNEAMVNAKRAAVEKGIGTIIQSETEVRNFMVHRDVVLTRTVGAVTSVTPLSESTGPDGAVTVKIRAIVSREKIRDDLQALRILLESMNKPRLMVLMRESNVNDSAASGPVAETEIINSLGAKGFRFVDPAAVEQLRKQDQALQAVGGDAVAAAALGARAGAEMIITGTAVSRVAEKISKDLGPMTSVQADVSLRVVVCATASVVTARNQHAAAVHVSPQSAGAGAIADAARKSVEGELLDKIVSSWQDAINNGIPLRVMVADVSSFKASKAVVDGLTNLGSSVVTVTRRDWNQTTGLLELEVVYKGTGDGFCEVVDGVKLVGGYTLAVTGATAGAVRLAVGTGSKEP